LLAEEAIHERGVITLEAPLRAAINVKKTLTDFLNYTKYSHADLTKKCKAGGLTLVYRLYRSGSLTETGYKQP
jgi:hypothetical protein